MQKSKASSLTGLLIIIKRNKTAKESKGIAARARSHSSALIVPTSKFREASRAKLAADEEIYVTEI